MTYEEYVRAFGKYPNSFLDYHMLNYAIPKHKLNRYQEASEDHNGFYFCGNEVGDITRKTFSKLITRPEKSYAENFWTRKFETDFDRETWGIVYNSTKETRLRVLHWKIISNIYPTNILLKKMKIKNNDTCDWCLYFVT